MDAKHIFFGVIAIVVIAGVALALMNTGVSYHSDDSPVLYFYRDDCIHCQNQKPILEELGKDGYRIKLMDMNKNPRYWQLYGVTGTPTFIADNGKGERLEGIQTKETLIQFFDENGAKVA